MIEHLNRNIKDITKEYPQCADLLTEFGIGCVTCSVGICLLKDIIEIHNLSEEREHELMLRIAALLYPGRIVEIPKLPRKVKIQKRTYSPPLKRLVEEHTRIKQLLALIPDIQTALRREPCTADDIVPPCIDFIRTYADRFHHAKEEDILFSYFTGWGTEEIISVMKTEHEQGRFHVKTIADAFETKNIDTIIEHLGAYRELLSEHICKEDEVLYPWIDMNLSLNQTGKLYFEFEEADSRKSGISEHYKKLIADLEIDIRNFSLHYPRKKWIQGGTEVIYQGINRAGAGGVN